MSDRFEIVIRGSNQSAQAFAQAVRDMENMGRTAESVTARSGRSFEEFNKRTAAMGAAITSATLLFGEFSRAAAEDEAGQARLQQAIENTGASYDDYSAAVDRAIQAGQDKAFADDQVREALTRLNTVTGDTEASLEQMSLVMDLARARGIDLATAADIVGKVMGGNTAILARYGIQLDENATKEEALALLQQRSAGQAEVYANSELGWVEKRRIAFDEFTESLGAHAGQLQSILLLMPGLQAGYAALGGIIGGIGGLGAVARYGTMAAGAGALGTIGYGYLADDVGSTPANTFANQLFFYMSQLINAAIPGNPLDEQKYVEQMGINSQWDQIIAAFGSPQAAAQALGIQGTYTTVEGLDYIAGEYVGNPDQVTYTPPTNDEIFAAIVAAAAAGNMTLAEYLATPAVRGAAVSSYYQRTGIGAQGDVYGTGGYGLASTPTAGPYNVPTPTGFTTDATGRVVPDEFGRRGPSFNTAMSYGAAALNAPPGGEPVASIDYTNQAVALATYRKELEATYPAFAGMIEGINSTHDAMSAFKGTQDGLIVQQSVYTQQYSEYTGQLNALTAGYEILQQRQAEGVTLTQEEQALLDNYPAYYERLTGGQEDAQVAAALLAGQYAENMAIGDQMNQTLGETSSAVDDLSYVLSQYILLLEGVPPDVKTEILLNNADRSINDLIAYYNWLNSIPGSVTTVVETVFVQSSDGSGGRNRGAMHGGVVGYADGGVVARMAEAGPELLRFNNGGIAWAPHDGLYNVPRGTYVTPAPASRLSREGRGNGTSVVFNGNVTIVANDPRQFYDQLNEYARGGSRL